MSQTSTTHLMEIRTHMPATQVSVLLNRSQYIVACQAHPALVKIGPVFVPFLELGFFAKLY